MNTPIPETLFGSPFAINGQFPDFTSFAQLKALSLEAYELIGEKPWQKGSLGDVESTEQDLRAGFIGTIRIDSAKLVRDGNIEDTNAKLRLNGLLFELELTYQPTGKPAISTLGGLAIGNGADRFEVRAYDLERAVFGKIAVPELVAYLGRSKARGASGSGTSGRKTSNNRGVTNI